jgi:DNA replication ATP-dependent helicase Dna2
VTPNGADLARRLERLLHRERNAVFSGHRELLALPVEDRVESGDCLAGLRWLGEDGGGLLRLETEENHAKFRAGDRLRLGNGEEGETGAPVVYESFNVRTGRLTVRRDGAYRQAGTFDPHRPLQLDPEATSLEQLALEALRRLRERDGSAESAVRRLLDLDLPGGGNGAAPGDPPVTLNEPQSRAWRAACAGQPLVLVQGPPGTGKTWLLAHVVAELARRGQRVLVTAYTHRAVNNALVKLLEIDPGVRAIKVGGGGGNGDLRGTGVETCRSLRALPDGHGSPAVVGMTLFAARSAWETGFDVVAMDEASQVPLAYAAVALLAGRRHVLAGDHRQLGPIVRGRHDDPLAGRSLFEHVAEAREPILLDVTYRMNDAICAFPSETFYGGRLRPEAETAARRFRLVEPGPFHEVLAPELPAVLARIDHEGCRMRSDPEARAAADLVLELLVRQGVPASSMAVVAPFRAQLRAIYTRLRQRLTADGAASRPLPVVDTVERIQGQEREVIVVSLTSSDPDYLAGPAAGFFFSPRRLNVTLTRARTKLVVLGSRHLFRALPRSLDGLRHVEPFRRLYRRLPHVDLTERYVS